MHLGIVADTHDHLELIDDAVAHFTDAGVDVVLHCGDLCSPFAASAFDALPDDVPFHHVRGNNEGEWALADAVDAVGTHHGECATLAFDDRDVALYHGTSDDLIDGLVESGRYDVVCHGHTHERAAEQRDGTLRLNPGGIAIPPADEPFHVATLDTDALDVSFTQLG